MNANERIYVKSFWCDTEVDDYKHGQLPGTGISWDMKSMGFDQSRDFGSVREALEAVCECLTFRYDPKCWIDFGKDYGDEYGRFDGDTLVDVNNNEVRGWEVEAWKRGEKKLWNCHTRVLLGIRATRDFTASDEAAL